MAAFWRTLTGNKLKIRGFNQFKKCLRHITLRNKPYYFSEKKFLVLGERSRINKMVCTWLHLTVIWRQIAYIGTLTKANRWKYNVFNHLSQFNKEHPKKSNPCSFHFIRSLYRNYPVCFNLVITSEEYRYEESQLRKTSHNTINTKKE